MFYPGDPTEQRKRDLIKRLAGQRSQGRGAGGFGVSRQGLGRLPGFYGRGIGFGSISPALAGRGGGGFPGAQGISQAQASPGGGPPFDMSGDMVDMGGGHPQIGPSDIGALIGAPPAAAQIPPQLRALLGNYGQSAPPMPSGYGNRFF